MTIHSVIIDELPDTDGPISVIPPKKLEAVRYPDPILTTPTTPVDFDLNPGYRLVAQAKMEAVLRRYGENALGIAANQISLPFRMFSYWVGPDKIRTLVNPEIVESSGHFEFQEGCLSIPGMSFNLSRPDKVLLLAQEMDGKEVEIESEGVLGRLFQHEVDHLNGLLVWDRLDTHKRQIAKRRFKKLSNERN